jgi:hypothetical protein
MVLDGDLSMLNRRIKRHQLPCFLQVSNRYTGKTLGFLGNISEEGLMLISDLPLLVGAVFALSLQVPGDESGRRTLDVSARCLWSHEDETPGHFDSGFSLEIAPTEYFELIEALKYYFSFYAVEASA